MPNTRRMMMAAAGAGGALEPPGAMWGFGRNNAGQVGDGPHPHGRSGRGGGRLR